ncbi:MAG: exopolysaccharide biosynthesis polyprenyl glycosylphosphotransferase [Syntrophaceae bacterium]
MPGINKFILEKLSIVKKAKEGPEAVFYSETHFLHMLKIERKRTERSNVPFLLMLVNLGDLTKMERLAYAEEIRCILDSSLRETDIKGWYEEDRIIGVIFTDMLKIDETSKRKIFQKVARAYYKRNYDKLFRKIKISFHVYPEHLDKDSEGEGNIFDDNLYPDHSWKKITKKSSLIVKRSIDIVWSFLALLLVSPLLAGIAIGIKLTSPGPVFFRQERLGLNGRKFMFLKFRSMYTDNDPRSHQEYVRKLIEESKKESSENIIYKMTDDPRITPFGRFLRKSSLDEIPQFINVLTGEMSLVGPRPPIPYECDMYDVWHKRRLLSCKPGITGLWQVTGRSTTTFDEMVRMDLDYIENWSLWKDIKILFKTPRVVLMGKGAY